MPSGASLPCATGSFGHPQPTPLTSHHPGPHDREHDREEKYYADGEDAFDMRRTFTLPEGAAAKAGKKAGSDKEGAAAAVAPAGCEGGAGGSGKGEELAGAAEEPAAAGSSGSGSAEKKKPSRRR